MAKGGQRGLGEAPPTATRRPSGRNLTSAASFVSRDGSGDAHARGTPTDGDLFHMFHLKRPDDPDNILYPADVKPVGPISSQKCNRALGIMSASALSRGKRPYMEDMVCNVPSVVDEITSLEHRPPACFFGVFDGHGGYVPGQDGVCEVEAISWVR